MKPAPALARGEPVATTGRILETIGLPAPILRAGEIAVFHLEAEAAR